MKSENKEQKWVRKHPIIWGLIKSVANYMVFVVKVYVAMRIIGLIWLIF